MNIVVRRGSQEIVNLQESVHREGKNERKIVNKKSTGCDEACWIRNGMDQGGPGGHGVQRLAIRRMRAIPTSLSQVTTEI